MVQSGREMQGELERLIHDDAACAQIAANGLKTVRERHSCAHRAAQLISICEELEK